MSCVILREVEEEDGPAVFTERPSEAGEWPDAVLASVRLIIYILTEWLSAQSLTH